LAERICAVCGDMGGEIKMELWWDSMQFVGVFWSCTVIWAGMIVGIVYLCLRLFMRWFTKGSEREV